MSSKLPHVDVVDKMFVTRGIDQVCQKLLDLPDTVMQYVKAQKREK